MPPAVRRTLKKRDASAEAREIEPAAVGVFAGRFLALNIKWLQLSSHLPPQLKPSSEPTVQPTVSPRTKVDTGERQSTGLLA